jgi:hypothetical protein
VPCCFSCGREGIPLFDVGCVNPDVKACARCIRKHSKEGLKNAADEALQYLYTPAGKNFLIGQTPVCLRCRKTKLLTDANGRAPLFCSDCIREWKRECA